MEEIKIDKPIRLIELFGGIGTQAMALRDLGADFERYKLVEFDKYCIKSYNAIVEEVFKAILSQLNISGVEKRNEQHNTEQQEHFL